MRRSLVVFASLALLAMSVAMVSAQGRGRGMMGGGLFLLRNEAVQKELNMTQPQIDKVATKQQEVQGQMRDLFQQSGGFQNMSDEDRQKLMTKVQDIQEKAVEDILDNKQMRRYHQLEYQLQGPSALGRKDVADKLKLTDEQRSKIADIQKQAQSDTQAAMQGKNFRDLTDEDRQKMADIRKGADEKITAVLTDEQQKQWKEMQGPKFDFSSLRGQRQRPGQ